MRLIVPYYSQHRDVQDKNWQKKACGLVCLKMVLDFHQLKTPNMDDFLKRALEQGAFGKSGWIHNKLLVLATEAGARAVRKEQLADESVLKDFLDLGNPVVVSLKAKRFSSEFEKKFHQVVLVGYGVDGFYYHDPDYQDEAGENRFVSWQDFKTYWRKMAIFISKTGEN